MRLWLLTLCVSVLYLLHQDYWNWNKALPLVFGFLPIGLFYHVCYSLVAALLMWLLVTLAWPAHLENPAPDLHPRGQVRSAGAKNNR